MKRKWQRTLLRVSTTRSAASAPPAVVADPAEVDWLRQQAQRALTSEPHAHVDVWRIVGRWWGVRRLRAAAALSVLAVVVGHGARAQTDPSIHEFAIIPASQAASNTAGPDGNL